jgi:predicted dienelactone hydrolase
MSTLSAGPPVEQHHHPIGRQSLVLTDHARGGRSLGVDVWYPAATAGGELSIYSLMPGIEFVSAAAQHEATELGGTFPLVVFSHGRTGMRFNYSLLCEALAGRGAVVVSADHPGDVLTDWLLGQQADDRTNEVNRVGDAHFLIQSFTAGSEDVPAGITEMIDSSRIAIVGHSYGAYTALATAAGARGVDAHDGVRAIVGLQPYSRTLSDGALARITTPTLLLLAELDQTTPASSDGDRPWALLAGPTWRIDLSRAAHQAASDLGLYAELAGHVPGLPDMVRQYLEYTARDAVGEGLRPWRETLRLHVQAVWAFLDIALDMNPGAGEAAAAALAAQPGITLQRRPAAG